MGDLLKGKVAVVTGSGRGIGREHALALAAEGAMVVVNDIGVERDGSGGTSAPADEVVAMIRENGGEAVASYDDVSDYDAAASLINLAVDTFGRLDILINNAGTFQYRLFHQLTEKEWDDLMGVHLYGTFNTCHYASKIMMNQKYGRIINTASSQWRNPEGRGNYGAAKGAIVSLTWGLAFELRNYNITVNAIAPMGATRSFGDNTYRQMLADAGLDRKKDPSEQGDNRAGPEYVSPMVVYLSSDLASNVNGLVFRVGSGKIGRYSHPTESRTIYREAGNSKPWTLDELDQILPNTVMGGDTKAPFIP
ncbi:MAG: short-chain dehydrogenase [Chloroflexi bacterium]|nr:short-chain dehydrogenase [Chloroflexota bacterium]|tara:strand:- start:10310 stop:11233 length:924 start_codon:yes stop_codon:yes gene_type:complete